MTQQPEALRLANELESYIGRPVCTEAAAELRRLNNLCAEWEKKAATWLASPEAAKRLDGYRELVQRVNTLEAALRQAVEAMGTVGADLVCEASHHEKKNRHAMGEECPLQKRWHIAFNTAKQALGEA